MVDGLFTSLRFDPALQDVEENTQVVGHASMYSMVPYHRDRLVVAAKAFGWSEAAATLEGTDGYERFFAFLESHKREWDRTHGPRQPVKVCPLYTVTRQHRAHHSKYGAGTACTARRRLDGHLFHP